MMPLHTTCIQRSAQSTHYNVVFKDEKKVYEASDINYSKVYMLHEDDREKKKKKEFLLRDFLLLFHSFLIKSFSSGFNVMLVCRHLFLPCVY